MGIENELGKAFASFEKLIIGLLSPFFGEGSSNVGFGNDVAAEKRVAAWQGRTGYNTQLAKTPKWGTDGPSMK